MSESALIDVLYHRKAFDSNVPVEWPDSFDGVVKLLKRVGYVDPSLNMFRFRAGDNHCTIFYPEGMHCYLFLYFGFVIHFVFV